MNATITIHDRQFRPYIKELEIKKAILGLAKKINSDLENEMPLFIVVLNGAFMFASDLLKEISIPCEISFVKISSYKGLQQKHELKQLIGINENVNGRTVVILEDIVDSGNTIEMLYHQLNLMGAKQIRIATALFKPDAYKKDIPIDYFGRKIENEFVVGYGLDYNGHGRNLKDIHILI